MRAFVLLLALSSTAHAWDGAEMWTRAADDANPGGGGIFGTGSAHDYGITCEHCHVDRATGGTIGLDFTFTPALGSGSVYTAGQTYQVDVRLTGEFLGMSGCGQYAKNVNSFAATFEDATGATTGTLQTDNGTSQASCPTTPPMPMTGTTFLYADCAVIVPRNGRDDVTTWRFSWTAPPSGAGQVTIYYGATDGNCDMMSMGDMSVVGKYFLNEASASRDGPPPYALAVFLFVLAWRRRR